MMAGTIEDVREKAQSLATRAVIDVARSRSLAQDTLKDSDVLLNFEAVLPRSNLRVVIAKVANASRFQKSRDCGSFFKRPWH